ncbi:hypothetical protein [Bradyrhizobium sp. Cp5.3]|uniref:hypothetical protein n=1 Tax=Bradyrhizobium sp. Cp5.3 TaxID=443598 RepID=UPI0003FD5070|nr:hypothetical protein [Bradyrhizobium sp. Cp5.3]
MVICATVPQIDQSDICAIDDYGAKIDSAGGNLAFHVTKELERRGRRVIAIVMFDSGRVLETFRFPDEQVARLADEFLEADGVKEYVHSAVLRDKATRTIHKYLETLSQTKDDGVIDAEIHLASLLVRFMEESVIACDPLDDAPSEYREVVRSTLAAAFGSSDADLIAPVRGGASGAFPRVEGPASHLRNPHQYESMQIAAGIAPRVDYIDATARVDHGLH